MVMSAAEARVVDVVLTTVLSGYRNAALVGDALFPRVPVTLAGGQRIEFDKSSFMRRNTRRAPGSAFARIDVGFSGRPYTLENHGLEAKVPQELIREAMRGPGIDLSREAVQTAQDVVDLELECAQAAIATDTSSYNGGAAAPLKAWNDPDGKPVDDVRGAASHIRGRIGVKPNTLLLGERALEAAKGNPQVRSYFPNVDGPITLDMLRQVFEVDNIVIGGAVTANAVGDMSDIWGDIAILAYVAPAAMRSQRQPSFGFTYVMDGHPLVMEAYFDRGCNSYIHQVIQDRVALLTGMDAGFLLYDLAPV